MSSNQIKGFLGTILVHALLLLLFIFFGFKTPLPLPPEEGIEIDMGSGSSGSKSSSAEIKEPQPETEEANATQNSEEAPTLSKNDNKEKTERTEKKEVKKEEPKVDERLLYKKGKSHQGDGNSDGEGDGKGKGNKKGDGIGDGSPGLGKGTGFSLTGRNAKNLPAPSFSNVQGVVVVRIKVDRSGKVVNAEAISKGSTIANTKIWKTCEEYALKAKFSAKDDASEVQMGTITYVIQ